MHVISKKPFAEAAEQYPNHKQAIFDAYTVLCKGDFHTPAELKAVFPSLDRFKYKDKWWVIDLGGNHLRLLGIIFFESQKMYVKHIVSHAEYDKLTELARRNKL